MSLYIEFNLHFEDPILFQEFLPEAEEDFLEFETDDNKYVIRVFLSDRKSQLSPLSVIRDETNLIGHNNINCFGLTLCIEVKKTNEAIVDALKTEQETEELKIFVREIFDLAVKVRNGLVNYFRNEEMIYYIQPMTPYTRRSLIFF